MAIDLPTPIVRFGLMILSAQFAACGSYDWCSAKIVATAAATPVIVALTVTVAGVRAPTLIVSTTIGNVPTVVLGLRVLPDLPTESRHARAARSTLAGNFLIVGSLANIIVVAWA